MVVMFNREELERLLKAFYELTKVRVIVFDERGVDTFSYPRDLPLFCQVVRQDPNGKRACLVCDSTACQSAKRTDNAIVYECHAGLTEVITQITVNNVTVGYLLLGHIVKVRDRSAGWKKVAKNCAGYNISLEELREAYYQLPYTRQESLNSAAHILKIAAAYLYQSRIALLVPGSLVDQLNTYIGENLGGDLSSSVLCQVFQISRTALYHISMDNYGCGIAEHITKLRIQKAIRLLTESEMGNSDIAQATGFHDYNYFSKRFKAQTGFSPREYRKRFKGEADKAGIPPAALLDSIP